MQVGDERAHQAGLSDTSGERKAKAWKFALEIGDGWELAANGGQRHAQVTTLLRGDDLGNAIENFERASLWRTKAQAAGDRVDMTVHHLPPSDPNRSVWRLEKPTGTDAPPSSIAMTFGGAFGRFSTFRL